MDLTDVEMFLSIVSTKSISKSAEALFLSQPTMSHRLKLLEKDGLSGGQGMTLGG